MKKKKKNKSKNIVIIVVLILFLLLLVVVGKLYTSIKSYKIDSRVETLEKFKKDNPKYDTVGWLKVEGTDIDYPIITEADAIEYNDGDIQFLWQIGEMNKLNRVNTILGHNIMNLSKNPLIRDKSHVRFEQLMSFTYLDFAKKNEYIQFTIDGKDYLFKIFGVSYIDKNEVSTYNNPNDGDEYVKSIINKAKEYSIYDYNINVNEKDTLISLITCTEMFDSYEKGNFRVDARLVREKESTANYKVKENKNYKEVEKQMKGEIEDEDV
ncbi:MAG: class B sortase [Bacilli bacterium]|nr:class B sortase [Bacilli bacterium]